MSILNQEHIRVEDGKHNPDITTVFIIFVCLYQFIFAAGMWRSIRGIRKEFQSQFFDIIKISQIGFII